MDNVAFSGFAEPLLAFFRELSKNNNKQWFEKNKQRYKEDVLAPAVNFVEGMGERLTAISPGIVADKRTNGAGSIFRIYKDARFSQGAPYKTHLGIYFWSGNRPKKANPGFYVQIEPDKLFLFSGIPAFEKADLAHYRDAVRDGKKGARLIDSIETVTNAGAYRIGGSHYKRLPAGYTNATGRQAELLLHNGLFASIESDIPDEFFNDRFMDYCFERFSDMSPVFAWLKGLF